MEKACKKLTGCLGAVLEKTAADWAERCRQVANDLTTATPPKVMIHNPKMLVEKPVRLAFGKAVTAMYETKLKDVAADVYELLKRGSDALKLVVPTMKLLATARRTAKLAIVVNWAVDEILNHKPAAIEDLPKHSANLSAKLKLKGFGSKDSKEDSSEIPVFIRTALANMLKVTVDAQAAPTEPKVARA